MMEFPTNVQKKWINAVKTLLDPTLKKLLYTQKIELIELFCQTSDDKVLNTILSEHAQEAMIILVFQMPDTTVCVSSL